MRRAVAILALLAAGSAVADSGPASTGGRAADTLYVSPDGSDAASGDSPATALATLQRALRRAGPGTTVRVLPGRYVESARAFVRGTAEMPVRVVGHSGRPVFSGDRRLRWGLWLGESEHVVLQGLEFRDYTDIGLLVVESDHVTLRRLKVHRNGFDPQIRWVEGYGIHLDESSDLLVERNNVFRNGPDPRPFDTAGTGINGFRMTRAVIQRNRSHDNHGGGILVEDSVDVLVKRNRIFRNDLDVSAADWWDGGIWVDGGRRVRLIANRIWNNLGPGIEISDEDCQSPTRYVLRRNRSNDNYFGIFVWNFGSADFPEPPVLRMRGNDFSGNERQDVWIEPVLTDC